VTAHNAEGQGDTATSPSITPSAEVPDPVGSVEATANNDGTVTVKWDEANGQGNDVSGYQVEAIASGKQVVVGQSDSTTFTVPEGTLDYGTQYAFQVTTLAGAAASSPSAPSNSVTPFNVPDAPTELLAETASDAAGSIDVSWQAPSNNGRVIDKYIVRAGSQTVEVGGNTTTARVSGFENGATVPVSVVAVNEAGESDPAETTSNTMNSPTVQITGHSATANSITVNMTYDDGGGDVTCELLRDGTDLAASGSCDSLTQSGLKASTEHTYTVKITNPAGSATSSSYTASTTVINGQIYFGCEEGVQSNYCDSANGIAVYSTTNNNGSSIGKTHSGDRHKAYCWATGESVDVRGDESDGYHDYHPGKNASDKWIKIDYASNAYVPFVWINIDGVDKNSTGDLPQC
jgi:hypothetical protein